MLDTLLWPLRPPQNWWVAYAALVGGLFLALQISAAVMVYAERKVAALMQQRYGPWLVGPRGLLQPIADIVKLFFKEELQPKAADRLLFSLAPIISVATCFIAFAPVPFGATTTLFGWLDEPIALQVADLNVGVLFVFAIASIGVYGIVLAGWASNSKYSLLGGLRSSAQMISYELAYGMALATIVLLAGSMSFREIVDAQAGYYFGAIPRWNVFVMFPMRADRLPAVLHRRASPRPTARRSTSPRPSRSWWPATTPSTARCASPCSSWPSTSTWSRCRRWP